jgi:polysaccharide deacetylase 2 family uncharacterized protein YibQ
MSGSRGDIKIEPSWPDEASSLPPLPAPAERWPVSVRRPTGRPGPLDPDPTPAITRLGDRTETSVVRPLPSAEHSPQDLDRALKDLGLGRTDAERARFGEARIAARRRDDELALAARSGRGRLFGLLALLLAAVGGAALALALDRGLNREPESAGVQAAGMSASPGTPVPVAPPLPVDPGTARSLVVRTLMATQVPHGAIRHGRYPLRGAGRAPGETLDLVSFSCPLGTGCAPVLAALASGAEGEQLAVLNPTTPDREKHPLFRALAEGPRPALAVRAFPPGPRLTLVVAGLGRAPVSAASLLALDADLTFAVDAADPGAADLGRELVTAGREVLVNLGGLAAADEAGVQRAVNRALDQVPAAVGVVDAGAAGRAANRALVQALVEATRDRGRFFVDDAPAFKSMAQTAGVAVGARMVGPGTLLDAADAETVGARLKATEAQLVLEGEAVLVVVPTPAVLAAIETWLPALRARGTLLLRASEVAL